MIVPNDLGNYLPTFSLSEYIGHVAREFADLAAILSFDRAGAAEALRRLAATVTEFDSDLTGRGDSYRHAQRNASVRITGIRQLMEWTRARDGSMPATVLDVLGGDGLIARAINDHPARRRPGPVVITGDLSGEMVQRALDRGLPAVRQPADFYFLRRESVDAALLAYGTHHIGRQARQSAIDEAVQVVRPAGHVVVHDFDEDSPMAEFFSGVVHPCSPTGHRYEHFSSAEFTELFSRTDTTLRLADLYDPFIVADRTPEGARRRMCRYIADMYGVHGFFESLPSDRERWRALERYFDHSGYCARRRLNAPPKPRVHVRGARFVAEVPRMAIVAIAAKKGVRR